MPKPANKLTIAVDIDDVIYPLVPSLIEYLDTEHEVKLTPNDFSIYDIRKVWSGTPEEANEIFEKYKQQSGIHIAPLKDAALVLKELSKNFEVIVLTARDVSARDRTISWIEHHFPEIFKEVHLVGNQHDSPPNQWRYKSEVCRELGVSFLIDDNLSAVTQTSTLGIKALLFGDYPWNQSDELPEGVTRVKNWQEVLEYFSDKS